MVDHHFLHTAMGSDAASQPYDAFEISLGSRRDQNEQLHHSARRVSRPLSPEKLPLNACAKAAHKRQPPLVTEVSWRSTSRSYASASAWIA
jgi:hypothetical protein